jgi:AraC family transcriptional regulator of adaptative response/methylated-DNA-[protein]-cysteine methyltransferase
MNMNLAQRLKTLKSTLPEAGRMYQAIAARDASWDGVFFTGVRTTGIFCRPSCRAKTPKRANVTFFPGVKEALEAGYRACRRCHPLDALGAHPAWVDRLLRSVDVTDGARLRDAELRDAGIEPARARRYFQENFGMTFQAYSRARRLGGALSQLRLGIELDDAADEAGFESLSGFRDAFARVFGAPAGQADRADAIFLGWVETPMGPMVAGARRDSLCLLEFTNRRMMETQIATLRRRFSAAFIPEETDTLKRLRDELACYFEGRLRSFETPIDAPGTPFEERVWAELRAIPYGETRSYEELAKSVGSPSAVRAVGSANGRNRIAIVIPCHRVVNKSGALGGYGGGQWRKEMLLRLEQGDGARRGTAAER